MHAERLLERSEARRARTASVLDAERRADWGQIFTPVPVASFLAELFDFPDSGRFSLLDPGAGTGSLSAAFVGRAIAEDVGCALHIVAVERDEALLGPLAATLADCERAASRAGISVTSEIKNVDFLDWASVALSAPPGSRPGFDGCIMNPPYRKVSARGQERSAMDRIGLQVTNLYTAFLGAAAALLSTGGQLSAITPRSFTNGPYFLPFRRFLLSRVALDFIHVYERRGAVFADSSVLQESLVFHAVRGADAPVVTLSTSSGFEDGRTERFVSRGEVIDPSDPHLFIHVPVDAAATRIAKSVLSLPETLQSLGLAVSTGRVVDFRTKENLAHDPAPGLAPLLYPSHLRGGRVQWPQLDGRKPNAIAINEATMPMLLPAGHYCLTKRFTAKEERRRVVAGLLTPGDLASSPHVAIENHLNVFHKDGAGLEQALAAGLVAFLNTTAVDAYVRCFSGHTQINATDLRLLRYPQREALLRVGQALLSASGPKDQAFVDALVATHVPPLAAEVEDARAA